MIIHETPPKGRVVKGDTEDLGQAALEYARCSWRVFPCRPGTKKPLVKDWPNKATTDEEQISRWWRRWPRANIAVQTGRASGLLVVDEDRAGALCELPGELPATATARTGNGGRHKVLAYPHSQEVRNSASKVANGIDIRGEGGYFLVPPSRTTGLYEWLEQRPLADTPEWLLETLAEHQRGPSGITRDPRVAVSAKLDGPPILFGQRNDTLTSIAGILHDGERDFGELLAAIEETNRARGVPPIGEHPTDTDPDEIAKITRSIHDRPPSRPSAPPVEPQMLEELGCIELAHLWGREWREQNWLSARSIFATLILASREYARLIPAGVRLSMSYRDVALAARVTLQTAYNSVQLLRQAHLVRKDDYERSPEDAGAFVLVSPDEATRATLEHSSTGGGKQPGLSVLTLRGPRLRGTTPGTGKRLRGTVTGTRKVREAPAPKPRETVLRYSKRTEYVLDVLDFHGGEMPLQDLAQVVGGRPRDLRNRILEGLEKDRVLRLEGEKVVLQEGWIERLYEVLEITGEEEIVERTRALHAKQRKERWKEPSEEPEGQQEDEPKPEPDGDVIRSEEEVFEMAREYFFGITESEPVTEVAGGNLSSTVLMKASAWPEVLQEEFPINKPKTGTREAQMLQCR